MAPREGDLSLNEKAFILEALSEGIRLDGRTADAFRPLQIDFGDDHGVADVRLGKTRVIAKISAEVTRPYQERPFEGVFQIATELGPMASPGFSVGRQTEDEVMLSRIIEKAVSRSGALDIESLCIVAGQKCWSVRADVHFVNHDGNLVDATCIAVLAALQHFRRPDVTVEGEDVTIHSMSERVPVPLGLLHHPVCVTLSFFHGGTVCLLDTTLKEEMLREGDMTVTLNAQGELCQVSKAGGVGVDAQQLLGQITHALQTVRQIDELIKHRLKEDWERRNKGNLGNLYVESRAENDRNIMEQRPFG